MKRLVCLTLIINLLILSGCSKSDPGSKELDFERLIDWSKTEEYAACTERNNVVSPQYKLDSAKYEKELVEHKRLMAEYDINKKAFDKEYAAYQAGDRDTLPDMPMMPRPPGIKLNPIENCEIPPDDWEQM